MEIFLTSVVIAALITSIFTYSQGQKSANLKYITNERRKWRESVRSIYKNLSDSHCYLDALPALTELKTRINPYGRHFTQYSKDLHIWNVVQKIEQGESNFEKNKMLLLDYLSLLLKNDWERSKQEVKGNVTQTKITIIYVLLLSLYWFVVLVFWERPFNLMSLLTFLLVVLSYFVVPPLYVKSNSSGTNFSHTEFTVKSIIHVIVHFLMLILGLIKVGQGIDFENLICGIILICLCNGLIFLLDYERTYNQCIDKCRYNASVLAIKVLYD